MQATARLLVCVVACTYVYFLTVQWGLLPLLVPQSMVARLCESKKLCGAADTQLQVQSLLYYSFSQVKSVSVTLESFHMMYFTDAIHCDPCEGILCSIGPGLPRRTPKPLHHRAPEGHAAPVLLAALHTQHGMCSSKYLRHCPLPIG